jgi:hypothetical protein
MSNLSINRYAIQKYDHISKLPNEIWVGILTFLNLENGNVTKPSADGKSLVKFWIACFGDRSSEKKIDDVMFLLSYVPISIQKTLGSIFTRYLTDISQTKYRFPTTIQEKKISFRYFVPPNWKQTLEKISDLQQNRPRVTRLDFVDLTNKTEDDENEDLPRASEIYYTKFPSVTHIFLKFVWHSCRWNALTAFPNLTHVDANEIHILKDFDDDSDIDSDSDNEKENLCIDPKKELTFPNIKEIWNIICNDTTFLNHSFKNLVVLTMIGNPFQKCRLDLSGLEFLQEFGWHKTHNLIVGDGETLELVISGKDLRKLHINKSTRVHVCSQLKILDKLHFLSIDCKSICDHLDKDLASIELSNKTPNLKHLLVNGFDPNIILWLKKYTQITHLELTNLTIDDAQSFRFLDHLDPCTKLTKLTLLNLQSDTHLSFGGILSQIDDLTWENIVQLKNTLHTMLLPPLGRMLLLKTLKLTLTETDYTDILPLIVQIENVHLINPMIRMSFVTIDDIGIDMNITYMKPAVHCEEFLAEFHGYRIFNVHRLFDGKDRRLCKRLIFETDNPQIKNHMTTHNNDVNKLHNKIFHQAHNRKIIGSLEQDNPDCIFCKTDMAIQFICRQISK